MKKILLIGLLSSIPFLGYSQAVVSDPAMAGLTTTLITLLSKMISSIDAKDSAKEAKEISDKTAKAIEGIQATKKVLEKIQKVGASAYALGENAQDTLDTFNELAVIFKGSPLTNKTLEEMTALDQIEGWEDFENAKKLAIKGLTDFRTLDKNIHDRIDNIWNTSDIIEETIEAFGGSVDPTYTQIKNTARNIEYGNRLTAELVSILQGESALRQVHEELDIWEEKLKKFETDKRAKEEKNARDAMYESYDKEKVKEAVGVNALDHVPLFGKGEVDLTVSLKKIFFGKKTQPK